MKLEVATRRVALAGNPNTGKSTLFNQLTGSRAKVGNYPGVTVERLSGRLALPGGETVELVDVPGTYSLAARSEEEEIAIQTIAGLGPEPACDAVVVVVDATQVERNLYLALQVLGLGLPTVIALNMTDLAAKQGRSVDAAALARELGVPVVPLVALRGVGLDALRAAVESVLAEAHDRHRPRWRAEHGPLSADLHAVGEALPREWVRELPERRETLAAWALLSLDEEDELADVPGALRAAVVARRRAAETDGRDLEQELIRGAYDWIDARMPGFLRDVTQGTSWTDRIDRVLMHPALGFALFLLLMTVVFQSLFAWADPLIGAIEGGVALLGELASAALPDGLLRDFLVDGLIAGVGAVVVFLPQILLLFFFIGLMEDTGYMARVAVLMDRLMKAIGLHGRAFVPMLSGFACAVPAILATRTMERRRDRMLTMMVVPLMTCSARLPIYGLMIAALVPVGESRRFTQGLLLVGMYLFSTAVAMVAAGVLGRTMFKGPRVPLLIEMPPYRLPHWPSIVRMMWRRGSLFLREAGTVILVCTVVMWGLLSFPRQAAAADAQTGTAVSQTAASTPLSAAPDAPATDDARQASERLRASYAGRMGHWIEPAIAPLGFDWQIGIGLIGAFAAREVFVSTMAVVYGLDAGEDEGSATLRERLREQHRPDGTPLYTPLVCFSLMVFFALACQCMSTLAVLRRETASWTWPVFAFVYMTALAWLASFAVYQGGRLLGYA